MKVAYINREGRIWEFDSVKHANMHLKKGWRKNAVEKRIRDCKWLEISDREEEYPHTMSWQE